MGKVYWEGNSTQLVDVVSELPRHKNYPFNWRHSSKYYDIRDRKVRRVVLHQKAGGYTPGWKGVLRTGQFFVEDPQYDANGKWLGNGRGWPGYAYTIDIPFAPETSNGKYIIYLCNNLDTVSWHTSGWNAEGIGVAFQGYFKSRHLWRFVPSKGQTGKPSPIQLEILGDLWDGFLKPKFSLTDKDVYGHFEAPGPKLSCPGDDLEDWIYKKRQTPRKSTEIKIGAPPEGTHILDTWEKRQAALISLGFDIGKTGPNGNGVDGVPGEKTRLAIEAVQRGSGLSSTGTWDTATETALRNMLSTQGISQENITDLT